MRKTKKVFLVTLLILLAITSCNAVEVPRREYIQHILDQQETFDPTIHHRSWRVIEDTEGCDIS